MKLEHYVEINGGGKYDGPYLVRFAVGNQSFTVSPPLETRKDATWWRDQFIAALKTMVGEVTDS